MDSTHTLQPGRPALAAAAAVAAAEAACTCMAVWADSHATFFSASLCFTITAWPIIMVPDMAMTLHECGRSGEAP